MMIPRTRIDALTDGVFAIAMTILVLEIRLPAHASYTSAAELLQALAALGHEFLAYAISFFVLAVFWRGIASVRGRDEDASQAHVSWLFAYLFFMTCIPISTSVVGNYGHFAPAVWLYAANMLLGAGAAWGMALTGPKVDRSERAATHVRIGVLAATALASVAWSLVNPSNAMLAYLGNFAAPAIVAWFGRRTAIA